MKKQIQKAIEHLRKRERFLKQTVKACSDFEKEILYSRQGIDYLNKRMPKLEEELADSKIRLPRLQQRLAILEPSLKSHLAYKNKQKEQVVLCTKKVKLLRQLQEIERTSK